MRITRGLFKYFNVPLNPQTLSLSAITGPPLLRSGICSNCPGPRAPKAPKPHHRLLAPLSRPHTPKAAVFRPVCPVRAALFAACPVQPGLASAPQLLAAGERHLGPASREGRTKCSLSLVHPFGPLARSVFALCACTHNMSMGHDVSCPVRPQINSDRGPRITHPTGCLARSEARQTKTLPRQTARVGERCGGESTGPHGRICQTADCPVGFGPFGPFGPLAAPARHSGAVAGRQLYIGLQGVRSPLCILSRREPALARALALPGCVDRPPLVFVPFEGSTLAAPVGE